MVALRRPQAQIVFGSVSGNDCPRSVKSNRRSALLTDIKTCPGLPGFAEIDSLCLLSPIIPLWQG